MLKKIKKKIIVISLSSVLGISSFTANATSPQTSKVETNSLQKVSIQKTDDSSVISPEKELISDSHDVNRPWVGDEKIVDYSVFLGDLKAKKIQGIEMSNTLSESLMARITLVNGSRYVIFLPDRGLFLMEIQNQINNGNIKINVVSHFEQLIHVETQSKEQEPSFLSNVLGYLLLLLKFSVMMVFLGLILLLVQKYGMGLLSQTKNKKIKAKKLKVSFEDIQGIDEAKHDVKEVIDFMNNENLYDSLGANIPRGIILSGDPGSGKTMLAKAVAKELKGDFYQMSGSEFVEMFVGLGAGRIRSLFKHARRSKKAVIFIDEIDAIGKKRGGSDMNSETEQTLNQLLVELDGFNTLSKKKKGHILVIAATNRVDVLDEALLRPGRFDRNIKVNKPNKEGRKQILRVYLRKYTEKNNLSLQEVETKINLEKIARITEGFSGAELSNLINEALIKAGRRLTNEEENSKKTTGEQLLTENDIIKARDKILLGDPRHDLKLLESEIMTTAYHESGHAIVALSETKDPVEKVTITPHSWALGLMLQIPERESVSYTKEDLMAKMKVLMAGRAAEEVFIGKITTGASNDMERAFELAMSMISRWGFGITLGLTSINDLRKLSDITRANLETEARNLIEVAYDEAKRVLIKHQKLVKEMVGELLEKDTINREEIYSLWNNHSEYLKNESLKKTDKEEEVLVEGFRDDRMEEVIRKMDKKVDE